MIISTVTPLLNRFRTFLLLVLLSVSGFPATRAAVSVSQFGITWTFDRDYPVGQFANGDYWVVGPVRITSISPKSTREKGAMLHGSMINPSVNGRQGYDSRIKNNAYSAALNVGDNFPLLVPPGSSVLSAESYRKPAKNNDPQLRTIAILTVLQSPAPAGSFRPPYLGADKTLRWNKRDLRYDKLRSLAKVRDTPRLQEIEEHFARPWIEQKTNWTGRFMHPGENQPTYGRDMAHVLAHGLLSLQLDYPKAAKEKLLVRMVQYGIDMYGALKLGASWGADGGHNQGRKMPLLLAATVLNDSDMLRFADAGQHRIFQEDQQTWYISSADVGRKLHKEDGRHRAAYTAADIGIAEWGEKHAKNPSRDGRNWDTTYRTVSGGCTAGHVLTARLMGLEQEWNWPATFDYYERYWKEEKHRAGKGANNIPLFVAQMWKTHRESTPADRFDDENVATTVWQNIPLTSQKSSFTFSFYLVPSGDKMDAITGLSNGVANKYADLAAAVRFAPSGMIDARNGDSFQAANILRYRGGVKYRVVMTVSVPKRTYSLTVTPPGEDPVVIADNWKFRNEQASTPLLSSVGFHAAKGYHAVLNPTLHPDRAQHF